MAKQTPNNQSGMEDEEPMEEEIVEGLHITSREEVADLLGLSHITGSIGAAQEVAKLTVKEAVEHFGLPQNHITRLQTSFEDTLAAIP